MDGDITIGTKLDTKEFDRQIQALERDLEQMERTYETGVEIANPKDVEDLQKLEVEIEKTKNKIISLRQQKEKVANSGDVNQLVDSFKNFGSSIQNSISKVSRLALGIFGIRSAYMALRRASSDLASYDQQYATNLEYIRYVLTQAIAPVLQWIVNLAAKLLGYINAIMQAWFGINLFSRGSAESFQKMKAGASGASKAVKEIKKQLAGFDEINMLTDQSDTGTSAGAGGVGMPNFDLSAMQGEVPEWLQWIIDHKDEILSILAGIATALTLIHFGVSALTAIGIGAMVAGLLITIKSLKKYLEAPTWENFGKIIQGIGIFLTGLLGIILGFPGVVAGVVVFIVGLIIQHWNEIKSSLQGGIDWLKGKSDWVHQMFGDTIGNIYDITIKDLQLILDWFDMTFNNIKQILDGIIQFVKGVFTGNWREAWEGVRKIFGGIFDWIKNTFFTLIDIAWNGLSNFASTIGNVVASIFKNIVNAVLRTIENVLNSPIRAVNRLIGVINAVPRNKLKYITNI